MFPDMQIKIYLTLFLNMTLDHKTSHNSHPWTFLLCFSFLSVWPSFCLLLIVSLCSGVSHHYPHLRSPYKLHSVQCFFVRYRWCLRVVSTLLYWINPMWIIKDCLLLFFIFVRYSCTTPWHIRVNFSEIQIYTSDESWINKLPWCIVC